MKSKVTHFAKFITSSLVFTGAGNLALAETRYQWNGSPIASSDWNTAANWSATGGGLTAGPGASGISGNYRLNVYSGTGATLSYSATQGSTTYANIEPGGRGLVISSATGVIPGIMEITGGNFSTFGSSLEDVIGNAAPGTLIVSGGTFTGAAAGSWLGLNSQNVSGLSELQISGSGNASFTTLKMGGYQATVNLYGGTLVANQIADINDMGAPGDSNTTFNFNGGSLTAGPGAVTAFMTGLTRANVLSGGAVIDTNGTNITIGQGLLAPLAGNSGGLTKNGAGTLTLSGINTYIGDTTVSNGTLELADDAQIKFVVTEDPEANMVTGSGSATFHGDFNIDTSSITGSTGYIWLLVDRANLTGESFGASFTVIGFTDPEMDDTWTMTDSRGTWTFDEATGELTLDIGTDYDSWGGSYGLASGSENGDLDGDGLTNHEEYAFGLLPNSGASVNPITNPLNKTSGKFSYMRRDPNMTDLSYQIWFSEDLVNWTQDTDSLESAVPIPSTENQSVEVTLSALPGNPLPTKLFIQVRAQ